MQVGTVGASNGAFVSNSLIFVGNNTVYSNITPSGIFTGTGTFAGAVSGITTLAAGNTTITGFATVASARGAVAVPTAGQNNSAFYVSGSDTAYGLLFGTDPATGKGWIQSQRTDGTATTYNLKLNPTGSGIEAGNTTITGFANVSVSVNSALFTVGTSVVINATSMTTSGGQFVANSTGISVSGSITSACSSFVVSSTGVLTSPDLVDTVGYKGLPQNAKTAAYGLALTDMGKMINTTTGGVVIPANANVAFPLGSTIVIYNNSASNQTISITTDTIYLAGTATTGSRTLAQRGLATCVKVANTTWVVSGAGVT